MNKDYRLEFKIKEDELSEEVVDETISEIEKIIRDKELEIKKQNIILYSLSHKELGEISNYLLDNDYIEQFHTSTYEEKEDEVTRRL